MFLVFIILMFFMGFFSVIVGYCCKEYWDYIPNLVPLAGCAFGSLIGIIFILSHVLA